MARIKNKSVKRVAERIHAKVLAGELTVEGVEHMIDSLISNRDKQVTALKRKTADRKMVFTKQHVVGSLQDAIRKHGPITPALIESAAKRIYNGCFQVIPAVDSKPDLDDNTD